MAKISFEKALQIALEQHHAGHLDRAEMLYVEILRQDPGNVNAIHLLGVLAHQGQKPDVAVQLISAAIKKRPEVALFHYNLAESQHALGQREEAAASYARAVELNAKYFEAQNNLANILNELARYEEAEKHARLAVQLKEDAAAPHNNLGNALRGLKRNEEAKQSYRRAVELKPDFTDAVVNLAMCVCHLGRGEEGAELFKRAIQLNPSSVHLHNNLGATYSFMGRFEEAVAAFRTALELKPDHVEANNNLGAALRTLGHSDRAIAYFEKAVELDPEFEPAVGNLAASLHDLGRNEEALKQLDRLLERRPRASQEQYLRGLILRDLRRLDEAIDAIRLCLEIKPEHVGAITALGYALLERGDIDEARMLLQRSIELKPDPQTHSNVLLTVNYHPGYSAADLLELHRTWAQLHEMPHVGNWPKHENDRSPERKLRIGYVSPDFRGHSVSFFLEPILAHQDHDQFEVVGYAHVPRPDHHTWRLRAQIDHWRDISLKSPDEIAQMIREDEIDILVELAGHTGGNSLPVFARKPAPVQVNMIGFPSTTGLTAIDYRVTDALCDPPGASDRYNSEKLIRMPGVFWAYRPPEPAPEVRGLPADENDGVVTFTSVNNFTKVTPQVQQLWARLLAAVPHSRLILQTSALSSEHTRQVVTERFAEAGVPKERLEFRAWSNVEEYLALLERSDMTLDPFPFNGGTTTCHSLWMGAPVITLAGDRHASRMGLSMMTAIGLPEFIAYTHDQYVQIAVDVAANLSHLREVRAGMRKRLEASPLRDEVGYTRDLEAAFRRAWREWCASGS